MKVLLFNGSPHKNGCTYTALEEISKTLKEEGIDSEIYQIGIGSITPCRGCSACAKLGRCVINDDDVNNFVEKCKEFDGFVFGTEVTHSKPDPETFLLAAKKAGVEPSSCLVLEDSENGIRAAHAGGFPVICVPDLKRPAPEVLRLASFVVSSLDEVIPCIPRL